MYFHDFEIFYFVFSLSENHILLSSDLKMAKNTRETVKDDDEKKYEVILRNTKSKRGPEKKDHERKKRTTNEKREEN